MTGHHLLGQAMGEEGRKGRVVRQKELSAPARRFAILPPPSSLHTLDMKVGCEQANGVMARKKQVQSGATGYDTEKGKK